jgi:hypothetical protein
MATIAGCLPDNGINTGPQNDPRGKKFTSEKFNVRFSSAILSFLIDCPYTDTATWGNRTLKYNKARI